MRKHLSRAIPLAFVVGLVLALVRLGGGGETASSHTITATPGGPQFHVEIDMVRDGNTFCNPVDNSGSQAVGSTYQVAVCATDYPATPDGGGKDNGIGVFYFDVLYDNTLNQCDDVANSGMALDDNPDANAGDTVWPNPVTGDTLGGAWDCTGMGIDYPTCDKDLPDDPPSLGRAHIFCLSLVGPWTLGDNEANGVLGVVTFKAIAVGTDNLALANVVIDDQDASEKGSCNPGVDNPIPCTGWDGITGWGVPDTSPMPPAYDDKIPAAATPTPGTVGGVAELPGVAGASAEQAGASAEGSGWSAGGHAAVAGVVAVVAVVIAAGGWYARRRWLG